MITSTCISYVKQNVKEKLATKNQTTF